MKPMIAIPAIALLLYRAYSRKSLTPLGLLTAGLTATAHALHPWSVFFALLGAFFLAGTAVTKVNHSEKATLTTTHTSSMNNKKPFDPSVPHPRTSTQVLCNSLPATICILLHAYYLNSTSNPTTCLSRLSGTQYYIYSFTTDLSSSLKSLAPLLPYAILAHYASAAADTFSSELGILSKALPVLITDLNGITTFNPKRVPRGTNGGVTAVGIGAGLGGAALMGLVAVFLLPFCATWTGPEKFLLLLMATITGGSGSIMDSVLGALLQASVVDMRTSKVVEGEGGTKVILRDAQGRDASKTVINGMDLLSNNGVNLLMCSLMTCGGLVTAFFISKLLA